MARNTTKVTQYPARFASYPFGPNTGHWSAVGSWYSQEYIPYVPKNIEYDGARELDEYSLFCAKRDVKKFRDADRILIVSNGSSTNGTLIVMRRLTK
jgi:hypothetical protein